MEKQRIPSTDPSTWNGTFNVGDKVKIRIDFASSTTDVNSIFEIVDIIKDKTPFKLDKNGNNIGGFARPENPSGSLYILSNRQNWEGKDLELVSKGVSKIKEVEYTPKTKKDVSTSQKTKVSFTDANILQKIKELGLVPLFPDYYYFNSSKKNPNDRLTFNSDYSMFIQRMRFERPSINKQFYVVLEIESDTFITEMHFVIENLSGESIYRDDFRDLKFDNLPDVLNFFNEKYEIVAKVFNEMLLEKLKEELEEEKKKQEEQEQQEQEKSEQGEGEGEGQDGEGQDGEGQDGEGQGEGKPQKMSAKDIEKLLEELSKDQKGQSKQGQNDNSGDEIDLEDFLDKVEKGEAENDFTKGYKDKELKEKIDYEKRGEQGNGEPDDMDFDLPDFPEPETNSDKRIEGVLEAIIDMLNTDKEDIKRQFPTEKSAKSFVSLLSPNELDFIVTQVGLPDTLSRFEKQKLITSNFITELENI